MEILQIVPQLPPAINGLGDYSLNLAIQLRSDYKIESSFLVGSTDWQGPNEIDNFPVAHVSNSTSKELLREISNHSIILLHYVGYGYARKGCPFWLLKGIKNWKLNDPANKLITLFHEVAASGPPWKSVFWLSKIQKHIAGKVSV